MAIGRRRLRVLQLLVVLPCLYLAFNFVDVWFASTNSADGDVSAAIVLGAAQYNGEPSPVLRGRLDLAADLYSSGRVAMVVVTGGGQENDLTTEAKASYDYLREVAGVPDERIKLEVQGTSTYESLAAAARFLDDPLLAEFKVFVVTDPFHARRAELVAREVGLQADAVVTTGGAPFGRLLRETAAVSVGRLIGFRRLERFGER